MTEVLIESFARYYGMDWLAMIFGFTGAWMITNKNKTGFILTLISLCFALMTALIAEQFGFVFANLISMGIAIRGFIHWRSEEQSQNSFKSL